MVTEVTVLDDQTVRDRTVRDTGGLLAVFGALDQPSIGSAIDRFIPRASANIGWYGELSRYLYGAARPAPADLGEALALIAKADDENKRLPQPQKARLLFAISTIARLNQVVPRSVLPSLTDRGLIELAKHALAATGPGSFDRDSRRGIVEEKFQSFLEHVSANFNSKNDFKECRATLHTGRPTNGVIGKDTADIPMCSTSIATVNGIECAVVDTVARSDTVSLQELLGVVNPYNWPANYPQFFVSMDQDDEVVRPDGWRRVLETVDLAEGFQVRTPLKYLPVYEQSKPHVASLEYDLDESRIDRGDGQVHVDRGYINMIVTNDQNDHRLGGVRVRTRKVVHIDGISPFSQERLVCLGGYGTANADFLFGRATQNAEPPEFPFPFAVNEAQADAAPPNQEAPSPTRHAVPVATKLWTDAIQDVTTDYVNLASKWWGGALTMTDIADFSKSVTGKLINGPSQFMQAMNTPRNPGR